MNSINMFDSGVGFPAQFPSGRKRCHDASGEDAASAPKRQHSDRSTPPNTFEAPLMRSTPQMFGMHNNMSGMFFPQNMMGMGFQFPSPITNGTYNQTASSSSDDSGLQSDMSIAQSAENSTRSQSTRSADSEDNEDRHADDPFTVEEDEKPTCSTVIGRAPILLSPTETFATVPGRMTLLAAATKYKVSIGEIHRRISPPECLHASLVNGILRRAKAKDGNTTLRNELGKIGISLPSGRRKMAPATSFTALCEEESVGMARDFRTLAEKQFPATKLAESIVQKRTFAPQEVQKLRFQFMIVKDLMDELTQMMQSIPEHPKDFDPSTAVLDPVQQAVNHFSLVTHGFGHNALAVAAQTFATVAERGIKFTDIYGNMLAGGIPQTIPPQMDFNWM